MTPVNHFAYVCSVFSYTAYPTVVIEIDCFREDGSQSNCYKYNFTWASAADYNDWLVVANSLKISGTTAERLTGMFDALNLFLKASPKTFNGTARGTWTQTTRFNGPCVTVTGFYFAFEQTTGNFVDSIMSATMLRNAFVSLPGLIAEGTGVTSGLDATGTTTSLPFDPVTSTGFCTWGWFKPIAFGGSDGVIFGVSDATHDYALTYVPLTATTALFRLALGFANPSTTVSVTLGKWYLLSIIYDRTVPEFRAYLDTALILTQSATGNTVPATSLQMNLTAG